MFANILLPVLTFFLTQTSASRILVVIPCPAYSHQYALRPLWKELSLKGHQVILATTDPIGDSTLTNLTEIDMHETYTNPSLLDMYAELTTANKLKTLHLIHETIATTLDLQLSRHFQYYLKNETFFDLLIVESILPDFLAIADIYKCPTILISSFEVISLTYGYVGNPTNPVAYPDMVLPLVGGRLNFMERILSFTFNHLFYAYKLVVSYPKRHQIMKKYFGDEVRSIEELCDDVDLLMLNVNPITNDIRPLGPNTITFGGGNHILPPKPLPKDLQDYLDNAKEGCIYFSLGGTNTKSANMETEKIRIIMDSFSELPYKVLWKFEIENMITPPKNVKLISWAPQQDVLRHPNVKLFITQGGMQSLEESIISHVPMVMMPMFGDQEANAKRMQYKGLAKIIPHQPLPKKEEFKSILLEVIKNPTYKQNVIKTAQLLLDQPMNGVEKAVWWIEYVIRHKGAKHLRNPALDIPFYQYYSLDVIATLLSVIFVTYKTILFLLRSIKRLIWKKKTNKSDQKKKKTQ